MSAAGFPSSAATSTNLPQQATLAETHVFSPSLVNEFRFGFGRSTPDFPIDTPFALGPRIIFSNAQVENLGLWEGLPQNRLQNTFHYNNNLSWMRGAHTFKMGGEYYYLQADSLFDSLQRPIFRFANWDDFAAGRPLSYQQRFGNSVRENRVKNVFAFLQDDWKVTRNLTLNLGMRYEWAGGPAEINGRLSNLDLNDAGAIGIAGSGPFGVMKVVDASFASSGNWAPRVGFAWNIGGDQKTVLRGGYGFAYDFIFLNPITNQRFLPPLIITADIQGQANFTGSNTYANLVAGRAQIQGDSAAQVGQIATNVRNFGTVSPAIDMGLRNPQVQQWNLGLQRDLWGVVLKASYVGTKGNYLQRTLPINLIANPPAPATSLADEQARLTQFQAAFSGAAGNATTPSNRIDPRYNEINFLNSSANSNYHAFQFEAQKRLRSSLLMNLAYTWSKSIDDISDSLGVLINDSQIQQNPQSHSDNRGPSQFDLGQRLVISHHWTPQWGKSSSNFVVRQVLAGWGFSGITSFRTGFPVTFLAGPRHGIAALTLTGVVNGPVRANAAGGFDFDPRPRGSAGAPLGTSGASAVALSNYAQSLGLSQPLLGNFGTLGRGTHRLNGERNFDWSFHKNIPVREGRYVQIRGDFFNFFNNTSFQDVDRTINSPSFGQYLTVGQNAREIQLIARFVF